MPKTFWLKDPFRLWVIVPIWILFAPLNKLKLICSLWKKWTFFLALKWPRLCHNQILLCHNYTIAEMEQADLLLQVTWLFKRIRVQSISKSGYATLKFFNGIGSKVNIFCEEFSMKCLLLHFSKWPTCWVKSPSVWPENNRQMSIKAAQKWFH